MSGDEREKNEKQPKGKKSKEKRTSDDEGERTSNASASKMLNADEMRILEGMFARMKAMDEGQESPEVPSTWLGCLEEVLREVEQYAEGSRDRILKSITTKWKKRVEIGRNFGLESRLMNEEDESLIDEAIRRKKIEDELTRSKKFWMDRNKKTEARRFEPLEKIKCFKCERVGHYSGSCTYKTDASGRTIVKKEKN